MRKRKQYFKGTMLVIVMSIVMLFSSTKVNAAQEVVGDITLNEENTLEQSGYYRFTLDECSSIKSNVKVRIYSGSNFDKIAMVGVNNTRLEAGEYYILNYNSNKITIKVTPESYTSYEQEFNNSFDTANPIETNIVYTGNYNNNYDYYDYYDCDDYDDCDYYTFSTTEAGSVYIDYSGIGKIVLYSEDAATMNTKELITLNAYKNSNQSKKIRIPAGKYFIKCGKDSYYKGEDYTLKAVYQATGGEESTGNWETEFNNDIDSANVITTNTAYTGNIGDLDSEEDTDYYKLTLDKSGSVSLKMQIPRQTTNGMFKAYLYKDDGKTIVDTLTTTSNPTAIGSQKMLKAGDYYIVVKEGSASADSTVDYNLTVNFAEKNLAQGIALSLPADSFTVGDKANISYEVILNDSSTNSAKVIWTSADTSIVTVDRNGKITCIKPGKAYITAKVDDGSNESATILVEVKAKSIINDKEVKIESLEISLPKSIYNVNDTATAKVEISPKKVSNNKLLWKSENQKVATVDENGKIKFVGEGKTSIIAITKDGSKLEDSIDVEVKAIEEKEDVEEKEDIEETEEEDSEKVLIEELEISLPKDVYQVGDRATLKASILPKELKNSKLEWISEDEDVAIVDSLGRVKFIGEGEVCITAITQDGSDIEASIALEVEDESGNCNLSSIKANTGKFTRKFSRKTKTYTLIINKNKKNVKITPKLSDKNSSYKINGKRVKTINVSVESKKRKTVLIKVTAENGNYKTYKVIVKRG